VSGEMAQRQSEYRLAGDKYLNIDLSRKKHYKHVLLTGSTGYLGVHLLQKLIVDRDCHLYLIIRGKTAREARDRLDKKIVYYFGENAPQQMNIDGRVTVMSGDLQAEKLGLPEEIYTELAEKVDCIIHAAANVRHYGHYQEFYNSNVKATLELLELARTNRPKDFNYISTISVGGGFVEGKDQILFTEYDADLGQELDNYYLKTKLEGEKAVIAARETGVCGNIYRIGNVVFNSVSGMCQDNIEENAFYAQVKAFVNTGVVPDQMDEYEFSFVDRVAESIILLFDRAALKNETHHIYNPHSVKLSGVLTDPALNLGVKRVSFSQFIDHLYDNYDKPGFKNHIENIMLHFGWLDEGPEADGQGDTEFTVLSDKTNLILKSLGFEWLELEPGRMTRMIRQSLQERIQFLREVQIFSSLPENELGLVAGLARQEVYSSERDILWEGDINRNFYLILEGFVEVSRNSAGGWMGTIGVLGPGEFMGEENVFSEVPSSITAEALMGDTLVLALPGDILNSMIKMSPELALGLLKALNTRVRRLEKMLVSLG